VNNCPILQPNNTIKVPSIDKSNPIPTSIPQHIITNIPEHKIKEKYVNRFIALYTLLLYSMAKLMANRNMEYMSKHIDWVSGCWWKRIIVITKGILLT
jgi:hypothetical protein